jgi:hypothetical protein
MAATKKKAKARSTTTHSKPKAVRARKTSQSTEEYTSFEKTGIIVFVSLSVIFLAMAMATYM